GERGRVTAVSNNTCPIRFTEIFAGDFAASAGNFTVCFAANVVRSYSTRSPDGFRTQSRLPCAASGRLKSTARNMDAMRMTITFYQSTSLLSCVPNVAVKPRETMMCYLRQPCQSVAFFFFRTKNIFLFRTLLKVVG